LVIVDGTMVTSRNLATWRISAGKMVKLFASAQSSKAA
jgi:hypothetical protein